MKMKLEKGQAMPDWMVNNFNSGDIINAIKRKDNPNWKGIGSGESLRPPTISKQKYSWSELRRTPKGILAVLAWEFKVRKADFIDSTTSEFKNIDKKAVIVKSPKLPDVLMNTITEEE